jgi:ubiquinone/menaquinone biosynthesis C-methylase UbiE
MANEQSTLARQLRVARHFPPSSGELLLLDVGCGPGNSALQFLDLRSDLRIIGIDFSGEMLRLAQRMASRLSDGVDRLTWTQADVTRLPLPDSSLDTITGHSVYYMLEDRAAFLREALRVLRPGGRIILLDPLARPYPIGLLARRALRRPQISLALLGWHTVSRAHDRLTLEQMAARLHRRWI